MTGLSATNVGFLIHTAIKRLRKRFGADESAGSPGRRDAMKLSKDNPLLTAYALGELDGPEADEVAAAVSADASLQAEVEAIRAFAGEMEAEFSAEL